LYREPPRAQVRGQLGKIHLPPTSTACSAPITRRRRRAIRMFGRDHTHSCSRDQERRRSSGRQDISCSTRSGSHRSFTSRCREAGQRRDCEGEGRRDESSPDRGRRPQGRCLPVDLHRRIDVDRRILSRRRQPRLGVGTETRTGALIRARSHTAEFWGGGWCRRA
jgi:hypothetical protein